MRYFPIIWPPLYNWHIQSDEVADRTYTAAVVEFNPTPWSRTTTADERMATNLRRIVAHIAALPDGTDIVVFPESALTENTGQAQFVPPPAEFRVPCTNGTSATGVLHTLSCAALAKRTYVVVNLYTVATCTTSADALCPVSGRRVYNTNIVFDRSGTLISTYRKHNVYYEVGISSTEQPDLDTFTADFGVRFGHMICFDVLFERPGLALIAAGVRNIIFPSQWYSELPALTAVQVQQGWAQAHSVNLLAAGISRPTEGSTGSGIYSAGLGALGGVMGTTLAGGGDADTDTVIVRKVPVEPGWSVSLGSAQQTWATAPNLNEPVTHVELLRERLDVLTWRPVNVSETAVEHRLCTDAGFCCSFVHRLVDRATNGDDTTADAVSYEYIAAVQNGNRTFGGSDENLTVLSCSVIACRNHSDLATCATLHGPAATLRQRYMFETLVIGGEFCSDASMLMPSTLVPALVPLPTGMYEWSLTEPVRREPKG